MIAAQLPAVVADRIRELLIQSGHADCVDAGQVGLIDPDHGLVCACGTILGEPQSANLPAPKALGATEVVDPFRRALDLLDPTQVVTPEQVEGLVADALRRLEHGMSYEAQVIANHIAAKEKYELAYALAFTSGEGRSVEDRKQRAILDCQEVLHQLSEAEMVRKTVAAFMHSTRSALSGYQSLLKSAQNALNAGRPGP